MIVGPRVSFERWNRRSRRLAGSPPTSPTGDPSGSVDGPPGASRTRSSSPSGAASGRSSGSASTAGPRSSTSAACRSTTWTRSSPRSRPRRRASSLVLDGYLTSQATRASEGLMLSGPEAPSAAEMAAQLFLGSAGQRKRQELARAQEAAAAAGPPAFVAVDLLARRRRADRRRPAARAEADPGGRPRGERARPADRLRPPAGRPVARDVAEHRVHRACLQGGQQPLPAGRAEPRLGDGRDPPALTASSGRW